MQLKQFIPQEFCLECEVCCRFPEAHTVWSPRFAKSEIEILVQGGMLPASFFETICQYAPTDSKNLYRVALEKHNDLFFCPCFTIDTHKCKIYENRPFECKLYPFMLAKKEKGLFLALDTQCPYASRCTQDDLKKQAQYLKKELEREENRKFLARHPELFASYDSGSLQLMFGLNI
ncbi:YkgJ family cysteine cluster protein [Thermoproteota archaeon]